MTALWQVFKPKGMIINNSVVYFNISPVVLVGTTVLGYFLYMIFSKIFALSSKEAVRCNVTIYALGKSVGVAAIIDTGNSITDIMSDSEIIIGDRAVGVALFGDLDVTKDPLLATRYRTVPCNTISGKSILEGFRCDFCHVYLKERTLTLLNPILARARVASQPACPPPTTIESYIKFTSLFINKSFKQMYYTIFINFLQRKKLHK